MAAAYLPQPGLCQLAHNTQLFNHSRQLTEIMACVADACLGDSRNATIKQIPDARRDPERMDGASTAKMLLLELTARDEMTSIRVQGDFFSKKDLC